MRSILILIHCPSNTGYAIAPLEATFYQMALILCDGDSSRVHFAYPSMKDGPSESLPRDFQQYLVVNTGSAAAKDWASAKKYIALHGITTLFGFDQPVSSPIYKHFRDAGIRHFISYWGAPMSSASSALRLALKQLEVMLHRNGPDHYIFESQGMAETAIRGRGISARKTTVVHLGVDVVKAQTKEGHVGVAHALLGCPTHRKLFYYAGHMEERKGVAVIMRAANELAANRTADDWHVVLFGNRAGEETAFVDMLSPQAAQHVSFGGYRRDLAAIRPECYAGIIASTGWDSFTMSSIEMQASGLPLLVSDLAGLRESVESGRSGFLFRPGDHLALSGLMTGLLDNQSLRDQLSGYAVVRAAEMFSREAQVSRLVDVVRRVERGI